MPTPSPPSRSARRRILAVMALWFCMALIDVGIVNVALPSIQHDLGATPSDLQWVLTGYTLTFGAVLIAAGRAGDILGRSGLFLAGLAVFTAASLAAALAPAPAWLNGARLIEGVGAGGMSPQVYGMVQDHFHGAERGRAFGFLGMMTSFAVAIAPPLGGALIDLGGPHWGWRLTFLINVPLGIAGIALTCRWFPKPLLRMSAPAARASPTPAAGVLSSLDPVGSLIAALAVLALLVPFVEFHTSGWAWWSMVAGVALAWAWVRWERHRDRANLPAMVDLHLFAVASFANGLTIQTLYFLGMTGIWVLVALYAQEAAGMSALATGLLGVPSAVLAAGAAHWAGRRIGQTGRRLVIAGQVVALAGLALSVGVIAAHVHAGASLWWLAATFAVYGLGQGATVSPNQTLTLAAVPPGYAGSAGALVSMSQRIGSTVGIAAVTAVAFGVLRHASWGAAAVAGFALIMLLVIAAIGVGLHDLKRKPDRPPPGVR